MGKPPDRELTPRDRAILRDVILTYILRAEPVSSREVAKHRAHGLSAASIRNIMADLEELGYLVQPHTSAGRVPTREGYHLFIETMMKNRTVPAKERRYIEERLGNEGAAAADLMSSTSHLLSELSRQVGVVLTPALAETVLRTVDFVPLSGNRVLCVVVAASGFVDNKVIEVEEPLTREELVEISNYVTENFGGKTLRQTRDRLLDLMAQERAQMDRLMAKTIELAHRGLDTQHGPDLLFDGTTAVLDYPELADVSRIRLLLETFSQKARLVQMLNQCMAGPGVRVTIGDDSELTSELDFSLVTTTYGVGDRSLGTLGVFGPSRMEYERLIPLVLYLGETLSKALARTFEDGAEPL